MDPPSDAQLTATRNTEFSNLPGDVLGQIMGQTHKRAILAGANSQFFNRVEQSPSFWKKRLEVDHGLKYNTTRELYESVTRSKEHPVFKTGISMRQHAGIPAIGGYENVVVGLDYDGFNIFFARCTELTSLALCSLANDVENVHLGQTSQITREVEGLVHANQPSECGGRGGIDLLFISGNADYPLYVFHVPLYNRAKDIVQELRQLAKQIDQAGQVSVVYCDSIGGAYENVKIDIAETDREPT